MSREEKPEINLSVLEDFARRFTNTLDIIKRTCAAQAHGNNASALTALSGLLEHPLMGGELRKSLKQIHSRLHAEAVANIKAKFQADMEALRAAAADKAAYERMMAQAGVKPTPRNRSRMCRALLRYDRVFGGGAYGETEDF